MAKAESCARPLHERVRGDISLCAMVAERRGKRELADGEFSHWRDEPAIASVPGVSTMRTKLVICCVAALMSFNAGHARSQALSPVGLWQATDSDTKQPSGWFLVSFHDGVYTGILARMFLKPDEDPGVVCTACKDDRYNHPWLGLEIIRGMQDKGDAKYGGGTILDPRDGKVYKAEMTVTPDGQTLVVRGYVGIALFGENQYWTRLPDAAYSMLDPSVNPNPAAAAKPLAPARKPAAAPKP
jgi:uncharacterized protein (DUF2147 family)